MAGKPKASKSKRNSILFKMVSTAGTGFFYLETQNKSRKKWYSKNTILLKDSM